MIGNSTAITITSSTAPISADLPAEQLAACALVAGRWHAVPHYIGGQRSIPPAGTQTGGGRIVRRQRAAGPRLEGGQRLASARRQPEKDPIGVEINYLYDPSGGTTLPASCGSLAIASAQAVRDQDLPLTPCRSVKQPQSRPPSTTKEIPP